MSNAIYLILKEKAFLLSEEASGVRDAEPLWAKGLA